MTDETRLAKVNERYDEVTTELNDIRNANETGLTMTDQGTFDHERWLVQERTRLRKQKMRLREVLNADGSVNYGPDAGAE